MEPEVSIWKTMFAGLRTSETQLESRARTVASRLGKGISKTIRSSSGVVASVRRCVSSAMRCWTSSRRR